MNTRRRNNLAAGFAFIVLGGLLLAAQLIPGLSSWFNVWAWPFYIIGGGFALFLFGLLLGAPGMAVPACVVSGIGGILYWQNLTGNWESWSYVWALIPGFVGIGIIITGLLGPRNKVRETVLSGLSTIAVSVALFLIFGSFFGFSLLGDWWPVLLILLGLWSFVRVFLGRSR